MNASDIYRMHLPSPQGSETLALQQLAEATIAVQEKKLNRIKEVAEKALNPPFRDTSHYIKAHRIVLKIICAK